LDFTVCHDYYKSFNLKHSRLWASSCKASGVAGSGFWFLFFSFRIMAGLGLLMLVYAIVATFLLAKNKLYANKKVLYLSQFMAPIGFVALLDFLY
jgi:hypothetical protein